jgi:hypothetical protein
MVNVVIAPGNTVDTSDPHVMVSASPIAPQDAVTYKMVLVVVTDDGRQSAPVELALDGGAVPS